MGIQIADKSKYHNSVGGVELRNFRLQIFHIIGTARLLLANALSAPVMPAKWPLKGARHLQWKFSKN